MLRSAEYDYMYRDEEPSAFVRRASRIESLSREDELSLIRSWQQHNSEDAYNTLSAHFQKLLASESKKFIMGRNMPPAYFGDALQEANIAFRRAIDQFDETKQQRLPSYLRRKVKARLSVEMLKAKETVQPPLSANYLKVHSNLGRILKKLNPDGREPSHQDLVRVSEILNVETYHVMEVYRTHTGYMPMNKPVADEDDSMEIGDSFTDPSQSPEDIVVQMDILKRGRACLQDALNTLNERDRKIFTERNLTDPQPSYRDMAKDYGVSWQRVEQIDRRAFGLICKFVRSAMKGACDGEPSTSLIRRPNGHGPSAKSGATAARIPEIA